MGRLLLAALEAFAELGYHGTATRDIAARANMSPAAIYMHFPSKGAMLAMLIRDVTERIIQEMREAASSSPDVTERLKALVHTHVRFHAQWNIEAQVANTELRSLSGRELKEVLKLRSEGEEILEEVIREGVALGLFEAQELHATTFAILSIGIGVTRWYNPAGALSPDEIGAIHADLIANMLAPKSTKRSDGRVVATRIRGAS